jgi:hypothetical protein
VPYRQGNFFGAHGLNDGGLKQRMSGHVFAGLDVRLENPAGLSAIWAEENTRASLFDAMQRKETFATSGPHIKLRFFGGWEYSADMIQGKDWVKTGYAKGVPMGGDLPEPKSKAPTFVVWAVKDPTSGNLDRIQIVKGWARNGQSFEKIYDVAWAGDRKPDFITGKVPPIGSTVDIANATYTNTIGNVELKSVWTDPDFDPSMDAFYYARALEIPTPRWTTIQAKQLEIVPPETVPATVQERAWSSPIWYTPTAEAKKGGKPGTLVADLIRQGAQALNDQELTELLVGKSMWVRNTVTDGLSVSLWSKDGQRAVWNVNPADQQPAHVGDAAQNSKLGLSTSYTIKGGKVVESFGNTPVELTIYKISTPSWTTTQAKELEPGAKYLGARSDEFGFANYEFAPVPLNLIELEKVKR